VSRRVTSSSSPQNRDRIARREDIADVEIDQLLLATSDYGIALKTGADCVNDGRAETTHECCNERVGELDDTSRPRILTRGESLGQQDGTQPKCTGWAPCGLPHV
jgi:hypothetical protein